MYSSIKFSVLLATFCSFVLDCFALNITEMVLPSPSEKMPRIGKTTPSISAKSLNYSSYFTQVNSNNTQERGPLLNSYVSLVRKPSSIWTLTSCTSAKITQRTKLKSGASISTFSIGDLENGNYFGNITANMSLLNLNSVANGNSTNTSCSQGKNCQRYGARWLNFYLKVSMKKSENTVYSFG